MITRKFTTMLFHTFNTLLILWALGLIGGALVQEDTWMTVETITLALAALCGSFGLEVGLQR